MAKDTAKPTTPGRTAQLSRSIAESRRARATAGITRRTLFAALIWSAFVLVVGSVGLWARSQPRVAVDRVMDTTRTVLVEFTINDIPATESARLKARQEAPRVYVARTDALDAIRTSLEQLPVSLRDARTIDEVEPSIREQFRLDEQTLEAIRERAEGPSNQAWIALVSSLDRQLRTSKPILSPEAFQIESLSPNSQIELRVPSAETPDQPTSRRITKQYQIVNAGSPNLQQEIAGTVRFVGFPPVLIDPVSARIAYEVTRGAGPTFAFDRAATEAVQEQEALRVQLLKTTYLPGHVIFQRGDRLTAAQLDLFENALEAETAAESTITSWIRRAGVFGLAAVVVVGIAGYIVLFCPRIKRNTTRTLAIAGLIGAAAMSACYAMPVEPSLASLTVTAPVIFVAMILTIAYDRRTGMAVGTMLAILVGSLLRLGAPTTALLVVGACVAAWQLKEIRERTALIRVGVVQAVALVFGTLLIGAGTKPLVNASFVELGQDALLAGASGMLVAMVTVFILPSIEKMFDITTGMTLIELRDPKQELLRQLQQRAPGTYNHSLNVASLAESAADAIGANGLLAYVGALYHDIGKMNKPDYFVENQSPGINKHDKLSPAMSLLVIVGHVKDGMELAREFNLPRSLHHFIESHHGTTLVEYFFHRAKKQAEETSEQNADNEETKTPAGEPREIEYRYPGPRPHTKECAILMLCDAVESAARSMADPTPSRIDQTVRAIANKRLLDGQFDDSELTLRELNTIVESVSKTLAAIYHGRIAYPAGPDKPSREGPTMKHDSVEQRA